MHISLYFKRYISQKILYKEEEKTTYPCNRQLQFIFFKIHLMNEYMLENKFSLERLLEISAMIGTSFTFLSSNCISSLELQNSIFIDSNKLTLFIGIRIFSSSDRKSYLQTKRIFLIIN